MFRATVCPSSGETTVFMRHLVPVSLKQVNSLKLQGRISCILCTDRYIYIYICIKNKLCTNLAKFTRLFPYVF